ncbi:hypothetical protein [Burkholderia sp. Ac-20365]|uniref:hypothetical protein n=1 Tax=Burkholderia sp. Ac-20365 TaxID=2703897 RepID=UPI00197B41AA|nr:hypothetical protein [Burkholderia sp. Ac-20365]MBN3763946.1 hypothetical protein [Burkholderia sp. Ac-20365]
MGLVLVWFWFGFGLVWFGLVWFGLVWFGLVWFGLVWFGLVWFGLVWFGLVLSCDAFVVCFCFRWHPRSAYAAQALPLCGAALTFFAAAKKVSKESGLTPPALDLRLRAPNGSSASNGVHRANARC